MKNQNRSEYEAEVRKILQKLGGNPNLIDADRVEDARCDGMDAFAAAARELLNRDRAKRDRK